MLLPKKALQIVYVLPQQFPNFPLVSENFQFAFNKKSFFGKLIFQHPFYAIAFYLVSLESLLLHSFMIGTKCN